MRSIVLVRALAGGLVSASLLLATACGDDRNGTQSRSTDDRTAVVTDETTPVAADTTTESTLSPTAGTPATPADLDELVAGHNAAGADRINLVFTPFGWPDDDTFRQFARMVTGWDGHPVLISASGGLYPPGSVPDEESTMIMDADLGLFGYEPFRSHRDRFNVWVATGSPSEPYEWLDNENDPDFIDDQVIITLALYPDPEHHSRSGLDAAFGDPDSLTRTDDPFANVSVAVWLPQAGSVLRTVPHELGHAIFGLPDEYLGWLDADVGERNEAWPSCTATLETADEWWGDLVGEYDPMVDIYIDEMVTAGFDYVTHPENVDLFRSNNRIGFVEDGCYGVAGSYRSTEDSLMGRMSTPAFGLTNRHWMEQVLDLWSGT